MSPPDVALSLFPLDFKPRGPGGPLGPGNIQAGRTVFAVCPHRIEHRAHQPDRTRRNGMVRRSQPRKVTYFEPIPPRLARNTIIESTFEVGRLFRCTMRIQLPAGSGFLTGKG